MMLETWCRRALRWARRRPHRRR